MENHFKVSIFKKIHSNKLYRTFQLFAIYISLKLLFSYQNLQKLVTETSSYFMLFKKINYFKLILPYHLSSRMMYSNLTKNRTPYEQILNSCQIRKN